jgi:glycosyltransferase involved in cell wall biosynthesis
VPIYGYLSEFLEKRQFELTVVSDDIHVADGDEVGFKFFKMPLSAWRIASLVRRERFDALILFVDMRHLYLFPTYLLVKGLLRRRFVWWGQGRDLMAQDATLKNLAYGLEHALCDSIVLYAEHLKKYVHRAFHHKIFVANNTLRVTYPGLQGRSKREILDRFGIKTQKNIVCVGRLQKRKRLEQLVAAHERMRRADVGLVLVGPDTDGALTFSGPNIYKTGPLYGDNKFDLISASDVYCLPGAVGLSIVDAFHCGLPFVTEDGDESAEIMYLRDGENGFVVPRGDTQALADRLLSLLDDEELRARFSANARREVAQAAHIDRLCEGFESALAFAMRRG